MLEILTLLFRLKLKLTEIQMPAWSAMYASVLSLKGKGEEVVARAEANSPDPTQYAKIQMGSRASLGQISKSWSTENRGPAGPEGSTSPHLQDALSTRHTSHALLKDIYFLQTLKKKMWHSLFPQWYPQPPTHGPSLQSLSALVWKRHCSQVFLGDCPTGYTFCGGQGNL